MPPESKPTLEEVVTQLAALMPTKAPAWLQAFGAYLMAHFPEIVAFLLKLIPATVTSQQQAGLACCVAMHEASQDTGLKGPILDPFVKGCFDAFRRFIATEGPKALDALEELASKYTP